MHRATGGRYQTGKSALPETACDNIARKEAVWYKDVYISELCEVTMHYHHHLAYRYYHQHVAQC